VKKTRACPCRGVRTGEDHVDPVLHKERLQIGLGGNDLRVPLVQRERVVDGRVQDGQDPRSGCPVHGLDSIQLYCVELASMDAYALIMMRRAGPYVKA
jgi:hypothetical protein